MKNFPRRVCVDVDVWRFLRYSFFLTIGKKKRLIEFQGIKFNIKILRLLFGRRRRHRRRRWRWRRRRRRCVFLPDSIEFDLVLFYTCEIIHDEFSNG